MELTSVLASVPTGFSRQFNKRIQTARVQRTNELSQRTSTHHTPTHRHTLARTHGAAYVYLSERVRLSVGLFVCRSVFPSQSIHEYMLQFYYKQL